MDHFTYTNGVLHAEDVHIDALAKTVGTPFYCYSAATLRRHYTVFTEALSGLKHRVHYAMKANDNLAMLSILQKLGAGVDVVSEGEIRRALKAGFTGKDIVFSGVGKTREEMAYALDAGVFQFNVESEPELELLNDVAGSKGAKAPIAIRVNPDVNPETHAKISTGQKESKFGIPLRRAPEMYALAARLEHISIQGISVHIGSQLTSLAPFEAAFRRLREMVEQLRAEGHPITVVDLGGGLGIPYKRDESAPPLPVAYGEMVQEVMRGLDAQFVFEPGRVLVGNAGILVTKVIYVKEAEERRFVIVDAAMNDLLRPSLYSAFHEIIPVREATGVKASPVDIVGPVCETGDIFAEQRPLTPVSAGEMLAFRTAGAYGAVMASNYNSRLLVPEVLVDGNRHAVIRARQSYEALLAQDSIPDWL